MKSCWQMDHKETLKEKIKYLGVGLNLVREKPSPERQTFLCRINKIEFWRCFQ